MRLGLTTFARQPFGFMSLFFFFIVLASIALMVPIAGGMLVLMTVPAMTLALMIAAAQSCGPEKPLWTSVFITALRALRKDARPLIMLGVAYAVCSLAVVAIPVLTIDDSVFISNYLQGQPVPQEIAQNGYFQIALVISMLLSVLLSLAFWHAPGLVHWHGVTPLKSVFFSIVACFRNFGAFTVFGIVWFGIFIMAGIVLSLVEKMLVDLQVMSQATGVLTIGGILVMTAMFSSSLWFTFRDSFEAGR